MEIILALRNRNRRRGAQQRPSTLMLHRTIRDVTNPFLGNNFKQNYRLPPDMALSLVEQLRPYMSGGSMVTALTIELKVLAALFFFGNGTYQRPCGRNADINMSQASISRAIAEVVNALNHPNILKKWVVFPANTQLTINKNFRKFGVPGVVGYVDGTHVFIRKPNTNEELYVNRKGYHSLNVQAVCDSDLRILNVLAKYPGSSHDAFVWKCSLLRDKMMQVCRGDPCWLLGDSGYPLEPWLLTPVLNAAQGTPEQRYTEVHIRSRNCIERCFGVLKERFRCINSHRALEYAPTKAGCIVNACAVLHNMFVEAGLAELDLEIIDIDSDADQQEQNFHVTRGELHQRGLQIRADLVARLAGA